LIFLVINPIWESFIRRKYIVITQEIHDPML
jgi:hypothetical protein